MDERDRRRPEMCIRDSCYNACKCNCFCCISWIRIQCSKTGSFENWSHSKNEKSNIEQGNF